MNEENLQHYINTLLAHLDEQRVHEAGQQRPTTDEREAHYQQQPQTFIDVYVIERDSEELHTVESTLGEPAPQEGQNNHDEEELATPIPAPQELHIRTRPRWWMIALVVLCILLIGVGIRLALSPHFSPSASVTLVTQSQQLTTMSTVQVVTNGVADPIKNQVPGRALPAITMSEQQTVPTTGMTHQAAQAAHGFLTFYNAAPYIQKIQAGTLLTGADGVQVLTDQEATIPAAIMPTEGQVTVSAHATIAGLQGNIKAGDLYGQCCRLNVFVANNVFHRGQDARIYQTVAQQDINTVVSGIKNSLEQSVQAALQTQIQPSETLITPLSCTQNVTSNHQVGAEATQIHVTLDETCTGLTYTTQAVTTLLTTLATTDASKRLGMGYTTTGVHVTQTHATKHGLDITSVSLGAYAFTQDQQDTFKVMIAGMSKDKATATLLHMTGVQSVSITLKNSTTVPSSIQDIHLLFLQV